MAERFEASLADEASWVCFAVCKQPEKRTEGSTSRSSSRDEWKRGEKKENRGRFDTIRGSHVAQSRGLNREEKPASGMWISRMFVNRNSTLSVNTFTLRNP
ncbi:uncharacterized protein LOC113464884 [Ceratina calcarata]|uniref:Uncharacterized protein LOC113464884 n=1 Tax=Ceratina calcarata TaxID=156304 RepID=A0AAJ7S987_9HYME|nr:uncharacterized protein LOC113464884 [Ceratina calcarata]